MTSPFYKEPIILDYNLEKVPDFTLVSLCLLLSNIKKNCEIVNFGVG